MCETDIIIFELIFYSYLIESMKEVGHGVIIQSKSIISNLNDSFFIKVGSASVQNGGALDVIIFFNF